MKLNKTICPSCGATGTAGRYCEFCGNKIPFPETARRKAEKEDEADKSLIVEFQTEGEEAVARMLYGLSEKPLLPGDFYNRLTAEPPLRYYVPTWYFKGVFEAPWSCVKLEYETYEVYNRSRKCNETRTQTLRYPMNGIAMDSFAFLTCTNTKEETPEGVFNLIHSQLTDEAEDYRKQAVQRVLTPDEESLLTPRGDLDPDRLWEKWCEERLEKMVETAVHQQLPWDYEDLSCSYQYNRSHTELLLPFWTIHYAYGDEAYSYVTDGLGKHEQATGPADEQLAAERGSLTAELRQREKKFSKYQMLFYLLAIVSGVSVVYVYFFGEPEYDTWRRWAKEGFSAGEVLLFVLNLLCLGLTVAYAFKLGQATRNKAEAESRKKDFVFHQWTLRKKQLHAALAHLNFGMSDACTKALRDKIAQELNTKEREADKRPHGFMPVVGALAICALWLYAAYKAWSF